MKATTENNNTLNAARQAIIDSLSRPETKREATPDAQELDETIARKPSIRSGIVVVVI